MFKRSKSYIVNSLKEENIGFLAGLQIRILVIPELGMNLNTVNKLNSLLIICLSFNHPELLVRKCFSSLGKKWKNALKVNFESLTFDLA
jgi:hypothetical protein